MSAALAGGFWKDLERHHPGISSLHLPAQVAEAWKQRLRSRQKTIVTGTGAKAAVTVERISYRQCLTPVRAFYLDLAQWAIEEPGPVGRLGRSLPRRRGGNQPAQGRPAPQVTDGRRGPANGSPSCPSWSAPPHEQPQNAAALLQAARQAPRPARPSPPQGRP